MRQPPDHFPFSRVVVGQDVADRIDGPGRDAALGQRCQPFVSALPQKSLAHCLDQFCPVPDPSRIIDETRVLARFRNIEAFAAGPELGVVADGQHQVAVRGRESLVGNQVGMRGAEPSRHLAAHEVIHVLVRQPCNLTVIERHVHVLACA